MPWTLTTVPATVVAAGLLAAGVVPASAAELPREPASGRLPSEVGAQVPLHTCPALRDLDYGGDNTPCLDTDLGVRVPNPIQQAGTDLTTGVRSLRSGLQDAAPVQATGGLVRAVGRVVPDASLNRITKARPTVDLAVQPRYPGVLEAKRSGGNFLSAGVGPHHDGQNGVSAVDTSLRLDALHRYNVRPTADPLTLVAPVLETLRSGSSPAAETPQGQTARDRLPEDILQVPRSNLIPALINAPSASGLVD